MVVWVPVYASWYGPQNFLWLCDLCNFILLVALWKENSLLFSSQLLAVLVIDLLWCADIAVRLTTGSHLIGGTEYMFNPAVPLSVRLLSLFHVFVPPLIVYALLRLGYDRRAPAVQTVLSWLVFLLSIFLTDPARNINWAFGPEVNLPGKENIMLHRLLMMAFYPLVMYLPAHLLALRVLPRPRRPGPA